MAEGIIGAAEQGLTRTLIFEQTWTNAAVKINAISNSSPPRRKGRIGPLLSDADIPSSAFALVFELEDWTVTSPYFADDAVLEIGSNSPTSAGALQSTFMQFAGYEGALPASGNATRIKRYSNSKLNSSTAWGDGAETDPEAAFSVLAIQTPTNTAVGGTPTEVTISGTIRVWAISL